MIYGIPAGMIDDVWEEASKMIKKAVDVSHYTVSLEQVYDELKLGLMQLALAIEGNKILAAFVTTVTKHKNKSRINVILAGGDKMNAWLDDYLSYLSKWANAIGADALTLCGRRGWIKTLSHDGWKEEGVFMTRLVKS